MTLSQSAQQSHRPKFVPLFMAALNTAIWFSFTVAWHTGIDRVRSAKGMG